MLYIVCEMPCNDEVLQCMVDERVCIYKGVVSDDWDWLNFYWGVVWEGEAGVDKRSGERDLGKWGNKITFVITIKDNFVIDIICHEI